MEPSIDDNNNNNNDSSNNDSANSDNDISSKPQLRAAPPRLDVLSGISRTESDASNRQVERGPSVKQLFDGGSDETPTTPQGDVGYFMVKRESNESVMSMESTTSSPDKPPLSVMTPIPGSPPLRASPPPSAQPESNGGAGNNSSSGGGGAGGAGGAAEAVMRRQVSSASTSSTSSPRRIEVEPMIVTRVVSEEIRPASHFVSADDAKVTKEEHARAMAGLREDSEAGSQASSPHIYDRAAQDARTASAANSVAGDTNNDNNDNNNNNNSNDADDNGYGDDGGDGGAGDDDDDGAPRTGADLWHAAAADIHAQRHSSGNLKERTMKALSKVG